MKWNIKEFREKRAEDEWIKTIEFIPKNAVFVPKERKGKKLLVFELMQQLRALLIQKGFDEFSLPMFVNERDIEKIYDIEFPLAMQWHNHLAMVKKPNIHITDEIAEKIRAIAPSFNEKRRKELDDILEKYQKNQIHGENIKEVFVNKLGVRMEQASKIISLLFPKEIPWEQTPLMLRNNIQSSWLETIAVMLKKEPLPLQMFAHGVVFKRVDDVDENELRNHPVISGVIVDENISNDHMMELIKEMLKDVGITHVEFKKEIATSMMNIPGTEYNIQAENHTGKSLTIGKLAMLSPIVLSRYGIEYPSTYFTLELEKIAMVFGNIENPKKALYPQFYGEWVLTDKEIVDLIKEREVPETELGREISKRIVKTCELYSTQKSPCEFKVFEKDVGDNKLEVWVVEEKEGGQLCGPAYINEIYVYNGNILALPPSGFDERPLVKESRANGIKTGIRLINAFADYCAAKIEKEPTKAQRFYVKNIREPEDVNVDIPLIVKRYVNSKGKTINIRGPMFVTVDARIKKLWVHEQPR